MATLASATAAAGCQPLIESEADDHEEYEFFSSDQAAIVAAVANRFVPGTDDAPNAEEAGVVRFLDRTLGREPVYTTAHDDRRYQHAYEAGIERLDETAEELYGASVPDLDVAELDELLERVEDRDAPGWEDVPAYDPLSMTIAADDFFNLLRDHVLEGYYAWPKYGANRDLEGWKAIGYTGPYVQGYSPDELKPPWKSFEELEAEKTRPEHFYGDAEVSDDD